MKRMSIKKLSILGAVLMVASAVTAAIIPSNKSNEKFFDGQLQESTDAGTPKLTCAVDLGSPDCNQTAGTGTTGDSPNSSDLNNSDSTSQVSGG